MDLDVDALEAAARARFIHWDPRLWREIVSGPAAALAAGLDRGGGAGGLATLDSYLRLACEGVGLGYLFPSEVGRDGFMNLAFLTLVPRLLPDVPHERRPAILAGLWNLGENLETAAPWLRRIFLRLFKGLASLADLEARVAAVEEQALAAPALGLGAVTQLAWVGLSAEDRRFLPGTLHFVAPTVLCVHDRSRPGSSQGVWLADPPWTPLPLGPMGCTAAPAPARGFTPPTARDVRLTPWFATCANEWRGAASLVTSQAIVGWLPAPGG